MPVAPETTNTATMEPAAEMLGEAVANVQKNLSAPDSMEAAGEVIDGAAMKQEQVIRTIIFLDWDDTLLCSSVLAARGIKLDTDMEGATDLLRQLDELSTSIINVIEVALSQGEVHIVTNGETGWVELSCAKFVPRVQPLLEKLTVLSARSTFESLCPDSPMKWKFHAFQESLAQLYQDQECLKNILSFGDSHAEREAIRSVTKGLPNTRCKSIKFAERPSIEQLQRQLELVTSCFQYIKSHEEDLDLCMSLSVTPDNAANDNKDQAQQVQTSQMSDIAPAEVTA